MVPGLERAAATVLPTRFGMFDLVIYCDGQAEHLALSVGSLHSPEPMLVRLHSECLTGDVFGSGRCDCGEQLDLALQAIQAAGRGVVLYLRQEGRGIGLVNKIRAYALQDQGLDTLEANRALGLPDDLRDYRVAAEILRDLGVQRVRLLTNNPAKIASLEANGIEVVERIPVLTTPQPTNLRYLQTKQNRMGHLLANAVGAEHGSA